MRHIVFVLILVLLPAVGLAGSGAPVAIDGIYPDSGMPGTSVIVKGHGFALGDSRLVWAENLTKDAAPGFVEFNGLRAPVKLWQDNLVMVEVPANATSGPVRVTLRSGIGVTGNHFEVVNEQGEGEAPVKREYSFQEKDTFDWGEAWTFGRGGLYPSPYYFYHGYRPRLNNRSSYDLTGGWDRDGFLDFFYVSGPLLDTCQLFTGMEGVTFFPGRFHRDLASRWGWWADEMRNPAKGQGQGGKKKYRFQE